MLKKIFLFALFIGAAAVAANAAGTPAHPRAAHWAEIADALREERPRDLAAACETVLAASADARAWSEYALAAELRAEALAVPAGKDAVPARIRALQTALEEAPAPEAKIFLEARLARALADYARSTPRDDGNGAERDGETGVPAPALEELSPAQLRAAAVAHYENVLAQEDFLKKIPIAAALPKIPLITPPDGEEEIAGIFSLFDAPAAEFPTLYDFIARDAEKFFAETAAADSSPEESAAAFPAGVAETLYADPRTFLERVPADFADGVPAKNLRARLLQLLRSRAQFHVADADKSALARATLDRFALADAFPQPENPRDANAALEAALKNFIAEYAYFPISAEASEMLARFYIAHDREPEAHETADKAAAKFPDAKNADGCREILQALERRELRVQRVPDLWPASAPTKISVSAKNAGQLRIRAVPADWRDYLKKEHNRPHALSEKETAALLASENAVELAFPLENRRDFRARGQKIEIPAGTLAPGFYFVFFPEENAADGDAGTRRPMPVWVGDLAVIFDSLGGADAPDGSLRVRAVNAVTGEPIAGATVSGWNKARWGGDRIAVPETATTDALGEAVVSGLKKDRDPVVLVECALPDAAGTPRTHAVSVEKISVREKKSDAETPEKAEKILLFSDRTLYRPAQKISFKGVLARPERADAGTPEVFPGKKVRISLRGEGGETVLAETEAWSGAFGSFAGTLDAPKKLNTGRCRLVAECDGFEAAGIFVGVEEYRRPKSEAEISTKNLPPQALGGNASAVVAGTTFSGAPLAGAVVRWRAESAFDGKETLLASGEGALDADGKLKISWATERAKLPPEEAEKLSPTERREREAALTKIFRVVAEITDATGETVTAETYPVLGNRSRRISCGSEKDVFPADGELRFLCSAEEYADGSEKIAGIPLEIEIFRLDAKDGEFYFPREWGDLPDDALSPGEKVFSAKCETAAPDAATGKTAPALTVPAGTLAPGRYRVVARGKDAFGRSVVSEKNDFAVLDFGAEKFPLRREAFLFERIDGNGAVKVGETAEFLWGSGAENARAFVEVFVGEKRVRAFYTEPSRTQRKIGVPATAEMRGGARVVVSQMLNGRLCKRALPISAVWEKTLEIEPVVLNKKLAPGAAETWTFRITRPDGSPAAGTEVLAALCDFSAEADLAPHYPRDDWSRAQQLYAPRNFILPWSRLYSGALFPASRHFSFFSATKSFPPFRLPDWTLEAFGGNADAPVPCAFVSGEGLGNGFRGAFSYSAMKTADDDADGNAAADAPGNVPGKFAFPLRRNLRETAFFRPFVQTDENGVATVQFVVPEALTRWRLRVFAHDKELRTGTFGAADIVTTKDLTVQPDAPRFLREGDEVRVPVRITNRGNAALSGDARLDATFFDLRGAEIPDPAPENAAQKFSVPAQSSTTLFRAVKAPDGAVAMRFRAGAQAAENGLSDGEETVLPVLPRRVVITESRAAVVRPNAEAELSFENEKTSAADAGTPAQKSDAPEILAFRLNAPENAFDAVVLALPALSAQARENESSDSIFYRLYAAALAREIRAKNPQLRGALERWTLAAQEKFDSPPARDADAFAESPFAESPFADAAADERARRAAVAEFFDEDAAAETIGNALAQLRERAQSDGWPWFPSDAARECRVSPRVTREILVGIGRLRERVSGDEKLRADLLELAKAPLAAQDARLRRNFLRKNADGESAPAPFSSETAEYLYLRALFADEIPLSAETDAARKHYLAEAEKPETRERLSRADQAKTALALLRAGNADVPAKIAESLRQRALRSEELGMHWNDEAVPAAETQALMIELFSAVAPKNAEELGEMKIRLLTQKRTRTWLTARTSADAVFALLTADAGTEKSGGGATGVSEEIFGAADVKFFDAEKKPLAAGTLAPAPALEKISAKNEGAAPVFVSASRTFSRPLSAVAADAGAPGFSLKKAIFKKQRSRDGKTELVPARLEILRPGDEIVVRLTVRADRDFEFVRMTDPRGSGCEPADKVSGWRRGGGLWFYAQPRDAETRFFFERLPAGTHVIEYSQRVRLSGLYGSGFAEIRSLYAPEFSARSDAQSLVAM